MNVAIVKLSSIGDVVHALPLAAALKRHDARVRVSWVAERREATLVAGHPDVDDVIVADTRGWRRRLGVATAREACEVARVLRARRFDVALDAQGLLKSGILAACTRAPRRIGFAAGWSRERLSALLANERVHPPASAHHVVDQYVALLAPLGITDPAVDFRLPRVPAAEAAVDGLLAAAGVKREDRLVIVNPGAGRPDKRWPVERFSALTGRLAVETGGRVLVLWGPGEATDARAIAAAGVDAILAPATTLQELVALVRRARLVIAADTGPLHIAAAVGTPCLGLYGPTSAARNGPYGAGHRVLQSSDGRVTSIAVPTVLAAAIAMLEAAP